ncbi:CPBP family intramembrane glutamic endopeptidase [Haloglomus litoreum]|uniref:CPBP family intramembrane glutamic endopeptidase n=1 Tax=Haloglomus litoreum TaxID=3034026 RepID=UPI0023E8E805|nr:CPBP family intramembrane glutamic endopeptidase [Haloglomus sp. DT116]
MNAASGVERVGWRTLGLFVVAFLLVFLAPSLLFSLGAGRLVEWSGGVVTPTLLNTWVGLLVVVGGVALWHGGLTLRDLGVERSKAVVGIGLTALVWGLFTLAQVLVGVLTGDLSLYSGWTGGEATRTLGTVLGYWLGNAPFEELAFRGFLLVQLYLLLDGDRWRSNPLARTGAAIVASSLVFTLLHVPAFLWGGVELWTLGAIFGYSVALALVYVRTENVVLAIGLHALANFPAPVFAVFERAPFGLDWSLVWLVPAAILVLAWPRLRGAGRRPRSGGVGVVEEQ